MRHQQLIRTQELSLSVRLHLQTDTEGRHWHIHVSFKDTAKGWRGLVGPHGWPNSVMPLATAEQLIPIEQGEGAVFWSFNTAEFLTDWPCSYFFLRYGNYVKKSLSFQKRVIPIGTHTYNTREFIKTDEKLYAPFSAVFIMPKAFVQNHFLLSCFCQPGAPYMSVGPRGSRESLFSTEQTTPNLHLFRDVYRSWSCSAQSKEGPMSACCHFQLNKLTFSPNHAMSKFKFFFLCYIITALLFI